MTALAKRNPPLGWWQRRAIPSDIGQAGGRTNRAILAQTWPCFQPPLLAEVEPSENARKAQVEELVPSKHGRA